MQQLQALWSRMKDAGRLRWFLFFFNTRRKLQQYNAELNAPAPVEPAPDPEPEEHHLQEASEEKAEEGPLSRHRYYTISCW